MGMGEENTVKNDGGAMMMAVCTITEINYLVVSLFNDLVQPLMF